MNLSLFNFPSLHPVIIAVFVFFRLDQDKGAILKPDPANAENVGLMTRRARRPTHPDPVSKYEYILSYSMVSVY